MRSHTPHTRSERTVGGHLHIGRVKAELDVVFVPRDRSVRVGDANEIRAGGAFAQNALVKQEFSNTVPGRLPSLT